ncbi:MAG: hypothetical protein WDW38_008818 [Sanguina aurantia]
MISSLQLAWLKSDDIAAQHALLKRSPATGGVERNLPTLTLALQLFVEANEDPASSTNFAAGPGSDPVEPLLELLQLVTAPGRSNNDEGITTLSLLVLRTLKVLSRKRQNRERLGGAALPVLLRMVAPSEGVRVASEGANVLLNLCYEPAIVEALLRTTGVQQLLSLLSADDDDLQANAAGAIQSVSFIPAGRAAVLGSGGVAALAPLLRSSSARVLLRAAGAVHNLSSETGAIVQLRRGCSGPARRAAVARGLGWVGVAGSAAGTLQNVSREVASRLIIRSLDAVPPLARLLSSSDLQAQVCAAGALLNILGPDMANWPGGPAQRRALGRLMSSLMSMAIVYNSVFERVPVFS